MTGREKVMAICVGGTLAGLGLVWGVQRVVIDPLKNVSGEIRAAQAAQEKLAQRKLELTKVEKQWQALTGRTLAADPRQAQLLFQENIYDLLQRHGLAGDPTTKQTKISPGSFATRKHSEFIEVPLTINTYGTLKQVVGFLCDFYRQDYIARLDKVLLTVSDDKIIREAVGGQRTSSGRRTSRSSARGKGSARSTRSSESELGPDDPVLNVSIVATTLVLPEIKGVPHTLRDERPEELDNGRLRHELSTYDEVFAKNLFRPYQPPKPVPVKEQPKEEPVVAATEPERETEPEPVQPVEIPRPNAENLYVRLSGTLNNEPIAYVYDETDLAAAPMTYQQDDPIDDGMVLLICPQGLVVRVHPSGAPAQDYFYALGRSFADREELSPAAHPKVWAALEREFEP